MTRPVFTALAIDHLVGNFEVGKEFDALLVSLDCPGSQVDIFDDDTPEDLVQKFIFLGKTYRHKCKMIGRNILVFKSYGFGIKYQNRLSDIDTVLIKNKKKKTKHVDRWFTS